MSKKVILFFTAGMVPTEAERRAAEKLGTTRFRNAQLAKNDTVETCDEVAGLVPEIYKNKGIKVLDVKAEEPEKKTAPVAPSPQAPAAPAQPKPSAQAQAPATKK